ncbi:MAG: AAA family ATPase, partial [Candidatus Nanoarchaeia archaeon]
MASVENVKKTFDYVFKEVGKVVIGQEEMLRQMMIAIFCDSNALVESVPGLAKTLSVRTIADILDLKFARIQNTPDLMPSDITGTYIVEEAGGKRTFKFQPGPIFANIVLADEINRATPKTQAALLEAMQEKQVTVGNKTFELDRPFFVLATQNPIEQEGSLALDQPVFINGSLQTGKELLEQSKGVLIEDERGIQLHDIDAWTLALNHEGKLEKQRCLLYTLPYNDEFMTITTKSGKHISVTKNHPFLVNDRGATVWKKAEDLTKEDYLVNPGRLYTEEASFQTHKDTVEKIKGTINEIPFNTDFAFWIACILSDGHIGKKCVAFTQKNYPQALDRWVSISKQYGFNPGISESNGCRDARIYSKPLVDYLHARFGIKSNKEKAIPQQFLSLSDNMNREFV